ncbi:AAA family ATPase [Ruania albidiflava]|uniref:AAA family ATPase n=1 Tax=Ruania albidiflava TaxID=366586 RepID=UPI0023F0B226|nr:AAA family ATPase [Ruania albidiflava]
MTGRPDPVRVPPQTLAAVATLARAHAPQCGTTAVIAIDGPAGSGKTTLAGALAQTLDAQLVHMDDLYLGWSGLESSADRLREEILAPLWLGRSGVYRRYDWHAEALAESHEVTPGGTLVVEGVGCVRAGTRGFFSVIVWVEADDAMRLARGLARDGSAAEGHWRDWMRQERDVFARARTRELAHLHVDAWGRIVP